MCQSKLLSYECFTLNIFLLGRTQCQEFDCLYRAKRYCHPCRRSPWLTIPFKIKNSGHNKRMYMNGGMSKIRSLNLVCLFEIQSKVKCWQCKQALVACQYIFRTILLLTIFVFALIGFHLITLIIVQKHIFFKNAIYEQNSNSKISSKTLGKSFNSFSVKAETLVCRILKNYIGM